MTARKKQTPEGEVLSVSYGKFTHTIRITTLVGVFLATPFGANFLKNLGVSSPAVEQTASMQNDIKMIKDNQNDLSHDMANLKANNTILNSKVDQLSQTFQGFQVDFAKYRRTSPAPDSQ